MFCLLPCVFLREQEKKHRGEKIKAPTGVFDKKKWGPGLSVQNKYHCLSELGAAGDEDTFKLLNRTQRQI
jgi:hypothetical protein